MKDFTHIILVYFSHLYQRLLNSVVECESTNDIDQEHNRKSMQRPSFKFSEVLKTLI